MKKASKHALITTSTVVILVTAAVCVGAGVALIGKERIALFLEISFCGVVLSIALAGLLSNSQAAMLEARSRALEKDTRHLMRSERLASIGRLSAGIAHEINNALTSIMCFSSLLLKKAEDNQKEKLEIIVNETTRCRQIAGELLSFARENQPARKACDICTVIDNALSLTRNQLKVNDGRIRIIRDFDSVPALLLNENRMLEVFINMIINAVDAMPGGGEIRVTTRLTGDGKSVEVRIADTGQGIHPDNIGRVFEPFFTTKEEGKGTGLGLAVIKRVIDKHHGTIGFDSVVGKGTAFNILLPLETDS